MRDQRALTGWGRTAPTVARIEAPVSDEQLQEAVREAGERGILARGLGRSYGDAAQNGGGLVLDQTSRTRILDMDDDTGVVSLESGVSLDQLMRSQLPRGWFVPVTPGTRQVTVGGAIGADIHGKNHHVAGTFGQHVRSLDLLTADGSIRTLTPDDELFWATVGGMGLTGIILRARVAMTRVQSAWCSVDTRRCANLDELLEAMADDASHEYSVAWVDCLSRGDSLGRSVLTRGRFARLEELPEKRAKEPLAYNPRVLLAAPPFVPGGLLNKYSVAAFNELWFRKAPVHREGELQSVTAFFHPLDGVADWNRIYGGGGFLQYQVVVPTDAQDTVRELISAFSHAGAASFLAVLKRFGPQNRAPLSFPMSGWTLALDVPTGMPDLGPLLDRLDELVVTAGGRGYLAKDSRMRPETFRAMYPGHDRWAAVRDAADPNHVFRSDLARRLLL